MTPFRCARSSGDSSPDRPRSFPRSFSRSLLNAVCLLAFGGAALAQGRPWVDPPADLSAPLPQPSAPPAAPAPALPADPPPAPQAARPPQDVPRAAPPARQAEAPPAPAPRAAMESMTAARQGAARRLAQDYLAVWSSQDEAVFEAMPEFYAPRVAFHGRMMSVNALMNEKRRFARRWPDRVYRHRPETLTVVCEPGATSCTVRSVFEFSASHPRRARRASGVGNLEIVVAFAGDRPVIVAENSLVEGRARTARGGDFEEDDLE